MTRGRRTSLLGLLALVLFSAFVVYSSFDLAHVRCEVCIAYSGRSQCRSADAATREAALEAATTNVCAFLASGVTDSIACTRTPPRRAECTAAE